jgi:DNA repair protein RadC
MAAKLENAPHYVGHRRRLKARLADNPRSLADYEILELLLALTVPRRDTKPLAKALIDRFGSLKEAVLARPDQLDGIKGIGPATQSQWTLIQELHARLGEADARRGQTVSDPDALARAAMARLGHKDTEEFWAVFMDTKNRIINWEQMSRGTTNATAIFPREIAAAALRLEATNVILVHNHPGGGSDPSSEDILLTAKVAEACASLDIHVRDHIIVTDHDYYSFNEFGRL